VGVIEKLSGPVYLRDKAGAAGTKLDPDRDLCGYLLVGQAVKCGVGGTLLVSLPGKAWTLKGPTDWVLPPVQKAPAAVQMASALRSASVRGGSVRADNLLSPAASAAVRPATFAVRWTGDLGNAPLVVAVLDESAKTLWRQEGVDVAAGRLEPEEARKILLAQRESGISGPFFCVLRGEKGAINPVEFRLLLVDEEKRLEAELEQWDSPANGALIRGLGRIAVFRKYSLFTEAADESDALLEKAPKSKAALLTAISAHERLGDTARVAALQKQLSASPKGAAK
jgi:hypothetical protein